MSLFDKLRTALDFVEKKLQNESQRVIAPSAVCPLEDKTADPLADQTVKKYFEILCGMRQTFRNAGRTQMPDLTKKRFIEYFLNDVCDEEAFDKANELFVCSTKDFSSRNDSDWGLAKIRETAENSRKYCMDEHEAYRKFCQEEIATATIAYNNILEVIKDNVNYLHFSQGMRKMNCDYIIQQIVISDSFCEGNPITQQLVMEYLVDSYIARYSECIRDGMGYRAGDDIALLIIKALHFEQYGHDRKNYKIIDHEVYRKFVTDVSFYKKSIDNHPFDTEEYIEKFASRIKNEGKIFGVPYTSLKGRFYINNVENYFCDAACNMLWKYITRMKTWLNEEGKDISESQEYNDLFLILVNYCSDPDND